MHLTNANRLTKNARFGGAPHGKLFSELYKGSYASLKCWNGMKRRKVDLTVGWTHGTTGRDHLTAAGSSSREMKGGSE